MNVNKYTKAIREREADFAENILHSKIVAGSIKAWFNLESVVVSYSVPFGDGGLCMGSEREIKFYDFILWYRGVV